MSGLAGLELLDPWQPVSEERRKQLEAELSRELPEGHVGRRASKGAREKGTEKAL